MTDTTWTLEWDDELGIARFTWLPGAVGTLEAAEASIRAVRGLGRGPVPLLVDLRGVRKMERAARETLESERGAVSAVALVAGSAVTKMIGNFFIGMKRLESPIKLFDDEQSAVAWLREPS